MSMSYARTLNPKETREISPRYIIFKIKDCLPLFKIKALVNKKNKMCQIAYVYNGLQTHGQWNILKYY